MKFIEINNKNYEIKYTINTLVRMESDGIDVININTLIENVSFTFIRKLFFYGMLHACGKSLTENKAGDMMDEYLENNNYKDLITILFTELVKSLGYDLDAKDQEAEESDTEAGK